METQVKVLAFAGSLRKESFNKKLVAIAADGARAAGATVTIIDLRDYPLPVYCQDFEAENGLHPNAKELKALLAAHHAFLIASPEYNSSISGALKNAIDWASRPAEGEGLVANFQGKVAGLMSGSPGALGGLRGLVHVRSILENIGVTVVPHQVAVSKANEAINDDGSLKDAKQQESVRRVGADAVKLAAALLTAKAELRL